MQLKEALALTGCAETNYDGYTCYVEENPGDDTLYDICVCQGGEPPHFSKEMLTLAKIELPVQSLHAATDQNWSPVVFEEE